jgi:hypothetical protein
VQSKSKALLAMLAAGLTASACGSDVSGGSSTAAQLPLKRGFYVAIDTACEAASNATLLLVRRGGFNGARDSCEFVAIEQTGPQQYRVTERCVDLQAGPDGSSQQAAILGHSGRGDVHVPERQRRGTKFPPLRAGESA